MKNFMLILMLVMAMAMQWWIIPVAFGLWYAVKYVKRTGVGIDEAVKEATSWMHKI